MTTPEPVPSHTHQEGDVIDTLQSLVVAFVLAMTFRGFVTEGFVIPTGSMAPTLMGQHALLHSEMTGHIFPVGLDQNEAIAVHPERIADPMLGPDFAGSGVPGFTRARGMGDRILVLKTLYPFCEPSRFDVVVFKNPTDPTGDAANYIKRLVGLPNEQVWLTDGDVFAGKVNANAPATGEDSADTLTPLNPSFQIQRKPEHVQRAVWQRVHDSDFVPLRPDKLDRRFEGPPWSGDRQTWKLDGRSYVCSTADPTALTWEPYRRRLDDWASYNMLGYQQRPMAFVPVSDLRVSAAIIAQQAGLSTTLELGTRGHEFQFIIQQTSESQAQASMRMRPVRDESAEVGDRGTDAPAEGWIARTAAIILPAPGKVFNVEFWHVDQAMWMFIDGESVMEPLEYEWTPIQRLQFATGDVSNDDVDSLLTESPLPPRVQWRFTGSPVTLHHVRMDRDLHYRYDVLDKRQQNSPHIYGHAFGTHPRDNAAILGPDQFMMCGDNSQMSLDSRLWGRPHPMVAAQIDDRPFTVNRKLLIGKAWVVYFPAPFPITDNGYAVVPDFERLRFIR